MWKDEEEKNRSSRESDEWRLLFAELVITELFAI